MRASVGHQPAENQQQKGYKMKTFKTGLLQGRITRRTLLAAALPLAASALVLAATASDKNPVTRPFKVKSTVTIDATMLTQPIPDPVLGMLKVGTWTSTEEGTATHIGRFTNSGEGNIYFDTRTGLLHVIGSGTVIAADGEWLYWDASSATGLTDTTQQIHVNLKGGSGRFADATGGFVETAPASPPGGGEFTYSYESTGTLTY